MLLGSFFDEVAVKTELADQGIDLPETERWVGCALQVAAHEAVVESLHFQSRGAGIFNAGDTILLNERKYALNAADACANPSSFMLRATTLVGAMPITLLCQRSRKIDSASTVNLPGCGTR